MKRRSALAVALLLVPGLASAQRRDRSRAWPQGVPLPLPPPAPPPTTNDLAPVPDRDILAPRRGEEDANARIDPALIDPDEPRYGATSDRHGPQAREDRLLRQPGAGARIRVPFSY